LPGAGTFACVDCGSHLSLEETEQIPECPRCGGTDFRRDSIFEPMQERGNTHEFDSSAEPAPDTWLEEARHMAPTNGPCLALDDGGDIRLFPLERGWTRIGRSATANVRLDDPSVSRRHALIVSEPDASLRVLDDRSLNGVFVNGELSEWGKLADGDVLTIGRYHLFVLEG